MLTVPPDSINSNHTAPDTNRCSQSTPEIYPLVPIFNASQHPIGQAIRRGQMAVGAASTATSRPYLLGLAQLAAGLLPAVAVDPQTNVLEAQSAADALDGPIAVETSAVYVAAGLLNLWPSIEPQFTGLCLAAPAEHDILLSQIMARSMANVAGTLGFDPSSGQMWFAELTDAARTAMVDQCVAVHDAAQTCQVIPLDNLDAVGQGLSIRAVGAWMAPLALAVERRVPLYSDDVVLRAVARAAGVPAFGTVALLDALITAERWQPSDPDPVPATLFDHHVVDLTQAAQLVLDAAGRQDPLASPVLLNLARPALWQQHTHQAIDLVNHLVSHIPNDDAHGLASIVAACAAGWAAAFAPAEDVIARVAAIALAYHSGVTADGARVIIPAIQTTAAEYGVDPIPHLRQHLLGILTDPTDRFQMNDQQAAHTVNDALGEFG